MPSTYSPAEIASFLENEALAIHGISPEVHRQNLSIVRSLGNIASTLSNEVLAVQLFGSRGHCTSELASDIDINVVALNTTTYEDTFENIATKLEIEYPTLEIDTVAHIAAYIDDLVPFDADAFIDWAGSESQSRASLFAEGVLPSASLKLARMAVMEVIATYPSKSIDNEWKIIREDHAAVYIGMLSRIREKLGKRLTDYSQETINAHIGPRVMQERQNKYGIPANMQKYLKSHQGWLKKHRKEVNGLPTYQLYREVIASLKTEDRS